MNYWNIILGNICSLLAMGSDSLSSAQPTTKRVLWMQNLSQSIYCIGAILLRGYSAAVQNAVSILRNLVAIKGISQKWMEWGLTLLGVALGVVLNNLGWIGLLPVIANLQYTIVIFRFRGNEKILKTSFFVNSLMFAVFNGAIWSIVGIVTNLVVAASTAISLIKSK